MTVANEALRTILPIAGWSDRRAAEVAFTGGGDPVLPTPFRIGAAGAATVAASGLAAAELWEARTGRRQQVTVDLRQATASLRSGHYMKLAGARLSAARNSIMGVYPTRDSRWSYLHCNFPNHRAAALCVLGVAEDRDAVARAVATWNAADLEEAIIAAKGAGGMRQLGQPRPVAGGTGRDPAWARLRFALCLRSCRPLGVATRLRHGGADRQRHDDTSGGERPGQDCGATILPGLGDRLLHGLLDGIWRDGGTGTPDAGRWQLVSTDLSRPGRQMDCRSRRSAGCGAQGYTC